MSDTVLPSLGRRRRLYMDLTHWPEHWAPPNTGDVLVVHGRRGPTGRRYRVLSARPTRSRIERRLPRYSLMVALTEQDDQGEREIEFRWWLRRARRGP